jgi:predicted acetyltransferase
MDTLILARGRAGPAHRNSGTIPAMTPQIVHPVPTEEIPGWHASLASTFLLDPRSEGAADWNEVLRRDWSAERAWGARERDRWVATLRTVPRTITVPGHAGATKVVVADALTNVTVAATHRRRGLLTAMLGQSLRAARERGDALSILISAEWPIYGRFGYAPGTFAARHVLRRSRAGSMVPGDLSRRRQVEPDEFVALAPAVFEAARRRRAGQVDRDQPWWDRAFGRGGYPRIDKLPHNFLVHDGATGVDGLLAWTATRKAGLLPPHGAIATREGPIAASDAAHRDLWAYLSGIDGADEIQLWGAVDDPVRWLLADARTFTTDETTDFLWLRLLDVPAALSARRYAVAGELVLEVVDATAVSVAGRYRLRADGSDAACEPTDAPADLTVAQTALASAYLGGVSLTEQRITGSVVERTAGALQRADAMFATALAPVNLTGF